MLGTQPFDVAQPDAGTNRRGLWRTGSRCGECGAGGGGEECSAAHRGLRGFFGRPSPRYEAEVYRRSVENSLQADPLPGMGPPDRPG
ncbi:hypothetical protein GCM10009802_30610 [Streptomyces synnematoformans]|uniref:Uncharacterized protein n=1 Tax=Streptomyces synnematoformans TaxID=415721 RepID=A0ABN2YD34_9ACTN